MKKQRNQNNNSDYSLAHVLYQRLGSDWYAFTELDGDCFMTKVSEEVVAEAKTQSANGNQSRHKPRAA
jgi:hypothetical protein